MLKKTDLIVLKLGTINCVKGHTQYKANVFYRYSKLGKDNHLVFGEIFTKTEFDSLFEFAHTRVLRDFKLLGLLNEDNVPLSKKEFLKLADIHTYGSGRKSLKIWFFRDSRGMIYGFYPMQGTKAENLTECYECYLKTLEGDMEYIDSGDICFGNWGIPISYGKLRVG